MILKFLKNAAIFLDKTPNRSSASAFIAAPGGNEKISRPERLIKFELFCYFGHAPVNTLLFRRQK
jgi:hypothetical protein